MVLIGKILYIDESIKESIIKKLRIAGCVFAEEEAELFISEAQTLDSLYEMVNQRIMGSPIEYVLGWSEFCGNRIAVEPGVFVPRRRTEFLVHQAVELSKPGIKVVDLCCGSGAIGVAIAKALGWIELYSSDIDPTAVRCAVRNATSHGGQVFEGDLYKPLPSRLHGKIDLLVANTPYVPSDQIKLLPREARIHEPKVALDGGVDGLDIQRRVAKEAPLWLTEGGHVLIETSKMQAYQTVEIFSQYGLMPQVVHNDDFDSTIVIGTN